MAKKHHNGNIHEKVKVLNSVAEIRMNAAGQFSCEIGAETFWGTLPEVRSWATKQLRKNQSLVWHPIMCVHAKNSDPCMNNGLDVAELRYYTERFYVAWDGAKWVQCPWVVISLNRHICSPWNPSTREQNEMDSMSADDLAFTRAARAQVCSWLESHSNAVKWPVVKLSENWGDTYYVPYTEANWQTMLGVMEKMREIRTKVATMLSTETGWVQLSQIAGVNLLAAPASKPKQIGSINRFKCVACGVNEVMPELGEDTCVDCLKKI